MEFNTKELAEEILLGKIEAIDLPNDVDFLNNIDASIIALARDESNWSGALIARKRKEIMDRIATILNEREEEDDVTGLQRTNRTKRKRP